MEEQNGTAREQLENINEAIYNIWRVVRAIRSDPGL